MSHEQAETKQSKQRGGRGSKLRGYVDGMSPPTPAAKLSATKHSASLPHSIQAASAPCPLCTLATPPQMLPVGSNVPEATRGKLAKLSQLYAELQRCELSLAVTRQYLPKLKNSGSYVTDSITSRIEQIRAEIAALAKPAESTACQQNSSKSPAKP